MAAAEIAVVFVAAIAAAAVITKEMTTGAVVINCPALLQ
jgi:serine acetyltransferase